MSIEKKALKEPLERPDAPLSRWAKRKQAVLQEQQALEEQKLLAEKRKAEEAALPTDEDMPPIDSLTVDSDFTGFMSPKVSETLRRLALRKLFHSKEFNICDGLDDYDGDYTSFAKLGSIITADMKHQMEVEARKKLEAMKDNINSDDEQQNVSAEIDTNSENRPDMDDDGDVLPENDFQQHNQTDTSEMDYQQTTTEYDDEDDLDEEVMG